MTKPIRSLAAVVENLEVARGTRWILLDSPAIAAAARPGQFLMVGYGLADVAAPLLPRPFSVGWRSTEGAIGLLVREYGIGTRRLAVLEPNERVLLLGPLGRGFRISADRPTLCIAGGVGLAPFLFVATETRRLGGTVRISYGERSADLVFDPALIQDLTDGPVEVWTEDGSAGQRGLVVQGLDLADDPQVLACGPAPMLRSLAHRSAREGFGLQVSVEEHMGCGVGTCQGCVVPGARGGWIKSCTEGPVFEASELRWRT